MISIARRPGFAAAARLAAFAVIALGASLCAAPPSARAALTSPTDRCLGDCATAPGSGLFGTREMIGHDFARFRQWRAVMERSRAQFAAARGICAPGETVDCVPREWAALVAQLKGLPLRSQIALANDALNRHPYVPTETNWHRAMYWETPLEFLARGGQCQDYAIAKYELLRQAGVPAAAMRLVVLHDDALDVDHAVLVVYVDGEAMVLDILNPAIVPAASVTDYRPYYSINEDAWWYHLGPHSMEGWMMEARAH